MHILFSGLSRAHRDTIFLVNLFLTSLHSDCKYSHWFLFTFTRSPIRCVLLLEKVSYCIMYTHINILIEGDLCFTHFNERKLLYRNSSVCMCLGLCLHHYMQIWMSCLSCPVVRLTRHRPLLQPNQAQRRRCASMPFSSCSNYIPWLSPYWLEL